MAPHSEQPASGAVPPSWREGSLWTEKPLEAADADGFVVVSVKNDWATVYRTG